MRNTTSLVSSETSEYIMGQVRSIALIIADTKLHNSARNNGMVQANLEQLSQELEFLHSMLVRHPPYRPSKS